MEHHDKKNNTQILDKNLEKTDSIEETTLEINNNIDDVTIKHDLTDKNLEDQTISGNILTIESDNTNCNDEISWMVIGERNDKWFRESTMVDENGKTIVEKLKSETT